MLHRAAFSHHDYEDDSAFDGERRSLIGNVIDSLRPGDIIEDIKGAATTHKVGLDHLLISQFYETNKADKP